MDKTVEFPAEHDGFTLVGCGIGVLFFFNFSSHLLDCL